MHSMLRQNQIKLQDIKAYVRTCDRQSKQGPEIWAQEQANVFGPGTLVFLLEPAKRPPGLTAFASKSQPNAAASDTFRVKDLAVVVDRVEDKSWVLNITPSAYELRFLDTLFKEKATKAILEGIDFNFLIAAPKKALDDTALKEMRQLANLYGAGGSRRSLSQNPGGPEEPARAILGFLGVDWATSSGAVKPVLELGSVCHLIFAPEGQEESPLRAVIKGCFIPVLANEKLSDIYSEPSAVEESAPLQEVPQEPAPLNTPETQFQKPPEQGFASLTGLKTVDTTEGDTVFAPVDPSATAPAPANTGMESPADPFAPIDSPPVLNRQPEPSAHDLLTPSALGEPVEPELLKSSDLGTAASSTLSADAPKEVLVQEPEDFLPAWYLLTHDLDEMNAVGKKTAAQRMVVPEPQPKVDYSNQFISDFEEGHAGSQAIEEAEKKIVEDQIKDLQSSYSPATADEALQVEGFNDALFAESGAKSSMEIYPDPIAIPEKQFATEQAAVPEPESDIFKPLETSSAAPSKEGSLFDKITNELATDNPVLAEPTPEPTSGQAQSFEQSGKPTNLMDMLTADSDVFTTTSAKTAMPEMQETQTEESPDDNYNELADALSGLIDSRSIPPAFEKSNETAKTQSPEEEEEEAATFSFDMDFPTALTESGAHPVFNLDESQALTAPADAPTAPERLKPDLFDSDDDFESDIDSGNETSDVAAVEVGQEINLSQNQSHQETSEISRIDIRPELTLTEGMADSRTEETTTMPADMPVEALVTEPPHLEAEPVHESIITPAPPHVDTPVESSFEAPGAPGAPIESYADVPAEAIVTGPPHLEAEPVHESIITPAPPHVDAQIDASADMTDAVLAETPAEALAGTPAEAIVTEPPHLESEPVHESIITPAPPHVDAQFDAPDNMAAEVLAETPAEVFADAPAEAIVTEPPHLESEPVHESIITPAPPHVDAQFDAPDDMTAEVLGETPAETLVTEPPHLEAEPVRESIITPAPPQIEDQLDAPDDMAAEVLGETPAEALVTEPPHLEAEPVRESIITPAPPQMEDQLDAPEETPVETQAEALVPEPPHPEAEPVRETIITPAPPREAIAESTPDDTTDDATTKKKPIMLGTSRTRSPLLRPSAKGIKRATARPDTGDTAEPALEPVQAADTTEAVQEVAEVLPPAQEPVPTLQPEPIQEIELEPETPEPEQPTGPVLEPKLVISESARFMARLNQRLSEADKKLATKAEQAKIKANARVAEHLENCERVERDRGDSSQSLVEKHGRQLESIASQVKARINETADEATTDLNAVIKQAEQEVEQVKQELISTLRYAEHRARSDSESLQQDSQKRVENHIQERTQEFKERTEYVCALLEQAANEHIELADKRFERFKVRMQDELNSILASLERNVNSMNEEIDGSWERASTKLHANQKEFENTSNHLVRDCQLNQENKVKLVYVENILPRLIDNKAIFRTMLFDMKKNYEEQSDRIITDHLDGLESNIKNAHEELKQVISKCHASIDEVGRGQQTGLEELFDNTSARMQEFTHSVKTKLEKARTNLEHNQDACSKIAEYGPEHEDPSLSEERSLTRSAIQSSCKDAESSLERAISSGCEKLERVSDDLQHRLTRQREDWTSKVKQSSDEGLRRVKRAIQEAYLAIDQAKDKHME